MRVAILTLPLNVNIGGVLQAYALQRTLEKLGHEAIHIQPSCDLPSDKTLLKRLIVSFFRSLCGKTNSEVLERELLPLFANYHINVFRKKYLKEEPLVDWNNFVDEHYDAYIVGSDQIWRMPYSRQYFPNNFLSFVKDTDRIKISYAASFGTDNWEYNEKDTNIAKSCLRRFNAVSVREYSGIKLCKDYLNVDAKCVLDPTMLLKQEDYEIIVKENTTLTSDGTLLSYLLDKKEGMQSVINEYALNNRLIPFSVNNPLADAWQLPALERQQFSVFKWLRGFMDAQMVITDSYHACVFSILFNKPFVVIVNKGRGVSRVKTLLSYFDLEDRMVESIREIESVSQPIDYDKVNIILDEKRADSLLFLEQSLAKKL